MLNKLANDSLIPNASPMMNPLRNFDSVVINTPGSHDSPVAKIPWSLPYFFLRDFVNLDLFYLFQTTVQSPRIWARCTAYLHRYSSISEGEVECQIRAEGL
jgi:hypothetical protein